MMNISLCVLLVGTIGVITETASECYGEKYGQEWLNYTKRCNDYSDCYSKCDELPSCELFGICDIYSWPVWHYLDSYASNYNSYPVGGSMVSNCTSYVKTVNCTKGDDEEEIKIEVIDSYKTCSEDNKTCPLEFRLKYSNGDNLPKVEFKTADVKKFKICKKVNDTREFCMKAKYIRDEEIYVRRLYKNRRSKYGGTREGTWVGVLVREKSGESVLRSESDPITVTIE